jgi:hypothetical protein
VKTEWESQPSEARHKQSEVVANIKTDEDPTALFDQMTELIKRAAEEDGQPSSITTSIPETLDVLLKGTDPSQMQWIDSPEYLWAIGGIQQ